MFPLIEPPESEGGESVHRIFYDTLNRWLLLLPPVETRNEGGGVISKRVH